MLNNPRLKWSCLFTAINYTIIWQTSGQFFLYHSNHCASKLLPTFHYPSNHCASMCVVRTASQVDDGYHILKILKFGIPKSQKPLFWCTRQRGLNFRQLFNTLLTTVAVCVLWELRAKLMMATILMYRKTINHIQRERLKEPGYCCTKEPNTFRNRHSSFFDCESTQSYK